MPTENKEEFQVNIQRIPKMTEKVGEAMGVNGRDSREIITISSQSASASPPKVWCMDDIHDIHDILALSL